MSFTSPMMAGRSRQPFAHSSAEPGEPTQDPITRLQYKIGQIGPNAENRWMMARGRHLAGLGGMNEVLQPWDPEFKGPHLREMEQEDDVFGSGIFDAYGHAGTINREMGVFVDHPSLPGYIDREIQYRVSKDIYDITSGADVITVAGGGMSYQERGGLPYPFQGQAPCPPARALPSPTDQYQPYVSLTPRAPGTPRPTPPPTGVFRPLPGPAPRPMQPMPRPSRGVPFQPVPVPTASQAVAVPLKQMSPFMGGGRALLPKGSIVNAAVQSVPAGMAYSPAMVPYQGKASLIGAKSIVQTGAPSRAVPAGADGLGEDASPGWGRYAFAGILVGASAAMLFGATKLGRKRP